MEGGAAGFLLKDAPASELATAIRRAVDGERVVDPGLTAAALSEGSSPLTPREPEVLAASPPRHSRRARQCPVPLARHRPQPPVLRDAKLDARNRAEALRVAEKKGWL